MARAAVLGRVSWRAGTVVAVREETLTARTIALDVPDWPGHDAGQHVDVRLTAADGYTAVRSYSIASSANGNRIELTVERLPNGEVSPYLTQDVTVNDQLELRGPVGGWFVWRPAQSEPVQLIAGGSGLVPLMAMMRARTAANSTAPFRLLYSVGRPDAVLYGDALRAEAERDGGTVITYAYTRETPRNWPQPAQRIDAGLLKAVAWPASAGPTCYVCGATPFVESMASLLIGAGYDAGRIKTERFGGSGGSE